MARYAILSLALWAVLVHCQFAHPGLMYNTAQINTLRTHALSNKEPWASSYQALKKEYRASPDYVMKGPASVIGASDDAAIKTATNNWDADVLAVHLNALNFAISKDAAYANKVAEIADKWSSTLQQILPGSNFIGGLLGFNFVNGVELVRYVSGGWPSGNANFQRIQSMVEKHFVPVMYAAARPPDQPAAGGNQAFLGHMAGLAFSIFTGNQTGFDRELAIIKSPFSSCTGHLGGSMQALLQPQTGQNAEAGRDQGHAALEVGWVEQAALIAANQGHYEIFDFKSQNGTPLLLLAVEYYFKYNLGYDDVPFDTTWHPCCCGNVNYSVISNKDRGVVKPIGEAAYNYYVGQKKLSMPYTTEWLKKNRPLEIPKVNFGDFLTYGTLVWAFSDL